MDALFAPGGCKEEKENLWIKSFFCGTEKVFFFFFCHLISNTFNISLKLPPLL